MSSARGKLFDNPIGFFNTMLEYYLHIDPSKLSDLQWAEKISQLLEIRKMEGQKV